ncbi:MAG: hypothetical protein LBB26_04600 [Puniceicoccales bacterium]|jgi:hypothetical protein|nr:hypothetical protein [Puniceicoccales bacterium]
MNILKQRKKVKQLPDANIICGESSGGSSSEVEGLEIVDGEGGRSGEAAEVAPEESSAVVSAENPPRTPSPCYRKSQRHEWINSVGCGYCEQSENYRHSEGWQLYAVGTGSFHAVIHGRSIRSNNWKYTDLEKFWRR